ncbi:MAG: response regulator [Balneolaceae bacterium]|nr:response regulator [Balneolaceae bacterium]MBO6545493.1 response regulator [Balneolaceae bacterium]MBO6646889.1 response regulator [Balneolaceae bacterium]
MIETQKKVLIVEDDILLLLVQERMVKKFGYVVVGTACEGEAAYRMIKRYKPDVILMDINLEDDIKGTEVAQMIRQEGNETPIIFLSGEKNSKQVQKAKQLGFVDYLLKPVTPKKLRESLERALNYEAQINPYAA